MTRELIDELKKIVREYPAKKAKAFAAARAEGAREPTWDDAEKALLARAAEMKRTGADRHHADYRETLVCVAWLAANKPAPRED